MELFENQEQEEKKSFDNFFIGLGGSFLMTLILLCLLAGRAFSFSQMDESLAKLYNMPDFSNYMIAALFPSMFVFFFLYKTERWQAARGIIVAVLLSMVLIVL